MLTTHFPTIDGAEDADQVPLCGTRVRRWALKYDQRPSCKKCQLAKLKLATGRVLSELEWDAVFRARCKSKQGHTLSDAERALVDRAHASNRRRYAAMERDVFNATVPFGSTVKI